MSLKVVVHSAKNLPDVDFKGKNDHDPFAVLSFRGRKKKTPAQKETLDPTWPPKDATFDWPLGSAHLTDNEKLLIKVKDYEKVWFKRLLGQVEIPLRDVRKTKKVDKRAYELHDGKHRPILDATISLEIGYVPPGETADGRVSQKQEETKESPEDKIDDDHEDVDERESDEDDDEDEASGKGKEKRSRMPEKKRIRRRLRRQWSDKTKDFQIRIQILEDRHLQGSDIHPLVRVAVAGQRQHTNAAHSTNRPIYNKMLHFNFHGSSEAELFDQPIILEVFNSRGTFRSNALLGFFKFDIGYVYEKKGHCFINKWIMLSEPDGKKDEKYAVTQKTRSACSPAGYLKVSAVVLGPGDKLPVGVDATSQHDRDEDIDANCLMPVGVQRQSALFVLKVYQAKDLPQMDTGVVMKFKSFFARLASWSEDMEEGVKEKDRATQDLHEEKNLVDPYLTFSFGGKEVSTDVIYNKSEPQFNQVLRIPFMFPSMCERLKLQLMDWDQGSRHDHIGAAFLSLSSISGPGEVNGGFFPQFGPCFINFYGSPREYHQMPDKYDYLNKGVGEGVAYRGRVLVELKTMPTHSGVTQPDRISWAKKDTVRFESYKRLSNFTLFACFHEASMVAVTDRPVEFELSIGNKGTKFDESVAHSNTTPCKAIPAGFHYHYLPWGREKPCVWIESQWEDIAFRIEPLNVLNRMRESLEKELEELKVLKDDQQGLERMRSVFKGFSKTCSDLLTYFRDVVPTLSGLTNSLDEGIHSLRKNELNYLFEDSKAFYNKPESERKKENVTAEIRNYIRRIKSMAMEPQLSMPDVILWMMSGDKRVAYYRIPAHDLLFSNNVDACGKLCGKIVELPLKYPRREGADEHLEIPALVRMELWLGLRRHQQQWINRGDDYGEFRVFAEKYENQKRKSKTEWKPSTSPNWPNYSDAAGELKLPKDSFPKPDGWEFFGDPNVSAITTLRQPDENLTEFRDEMYEHERRKFPGGDWEPGKPRYTDTYGEETTLPIDPPTGWTAVAAPGAVNGGWTVDRNRAVDEDGWEYSPHRTYVDFGPEEKAFHLSRRKRLTRLRKRKPGEQIHKDPPPTDGWEYSRSLHESFHPEEKSTDCLRRRRLLHQIVPSAERTKEGGIKFPIFKVLVQGKKGKESALCVLPRMFVTYKCAMKCQLWVSIYQARGLISQDKTGKNDPYVRVTFVNKSQETKTLPQTLCPTWDQTLIFEDVDIYGNPGDLAKCPPSVVMELFDHDKGKHDFLGRCRIKPKVLVKENERPNRELTWRKVHRGGQDGGQILVECELFLTEVVNLPARPKKRGDVYPIRDELRPKTQKKAIEILSWGVRDLKGNKSVMIPKPSVEFELNQEIIKSDEVIGDMKACPNFCFPVLKRTILELPKNDEYAPPLNILVYDNNWFGKSLLGLCEIPSMKAFEVKPESQSVVDGQFSDGKRKQSAKKRGKSQEDLLKDKEVFDWWSKYHASKDQTAKDRTSSSVDGGVTKTHTQKYLDREYDTLTIYPDKLENQPEFQGFNDFITIFPLRRGKTKTTKDGDTVVGKFKGAFRVINNPDEHDLVHSMAKMQLPSNDPVNCIVRVYVVRATQLQPKDADGLADPYVIASLGEKTQGQPSEHIAKTLKPIFGRMFEFKAKIPLVKDLKIQVWDYDFPTPDDLIGETEIDLEQRLLSRYHATCGLPKTYFKSGPFEWRDTLTPFQLLAKYCTLTGKELQLDKKKPDVIIIDKTSYFIEDETPLNPETGEPLQCLALHLLHTKFGFVPEHVETRPLYSKERPDMEQGKLEMWVDIFTEEDEELAKLDPLSIGADRSDGMPLFTIVKGALSSEEERRKEEERELPVAQVEGVKHYSVDQLVKAPIFIDPRQPIKYELRVIIWNTTDVLLDDKTITGEQMSDIFVKAWIVGSKDKKQCTSVHERSLDGNGSFNWRMVFSLEYLPIEKEIVMREKVHHFGRDVRVDTMPPLLKVQIFDKDRFSGSDFLGDRELNLSRLDQPCVHPSHCGTSKDPSPRGTSKDSRPSTHNEFLDLFKKERKTGWWACYNKKDITGKVEMTLEILDEDEAKANPVGLGQSEPNQNPTLPKPIRPAHSFLWYAHPLKTFRYIIWRNYKGFFFKVLIFCLLVLLIAYFVYSIPSYAAKRVVGA